MSFNIVDVIIKLVSAGYPLYEFALIRAAAMLPLLWLYVAREGGLSALRVQRRELALILLRSSLLFIGSLLFGLSLAVMVIADAVAIYFIMPLIVAAVAGPILGEQVPFYRWGVMLVGFLGVLVIVQPGSGVFEPAALLALGAALLEGMAQIIARLLPAVRTSAITFYQGLVFLIGSLVLTAAFASGGWASETHASLAFLTRGWVWPGTGDFLVMLAAAPVSAIAMSLYVHGYKVAPVSFVTSFEYTGILWAAVFGFVFFADVPVWTTWAGAAIVIAAGLYMLHRDSRIPRAAMTMPASASGSAAQCIWLIQYSRKPNRSKLDLARPSIETHGDGCKGACDGFQDQLDDHRPRTRQLQLRLWLPVPIQRLADQRQLSRRRRRHHRLWAAWRRAPRWLERGCSVSVARSHP